MARVCATGALGASALISGSCGCKMGGVWVWATLRRKIPWNVRAGHAGFSLVPWTLVMLAYRIAADRAPGAVRCWLFLFLLTCIPYLPQHYNEPSFTLPYAVVPALSSMSSCTLELYQRSRLRGTWITARRYTCPAQPVYFSTRLARSDSLQRNSTNPVPTSKHQNPCLSYS